MSPISKNHRVSPFHSTRRSIFSVGSGFLSSFYLSLVGILINFDRIWDLSEYPLGQSNFYKWFVLPSHAFQYDRDWKSPHWFLRKTSKFFQVRPQMVSNGDSNYYQGTQSRKTLLSFRLCTYWIGRRDRISRTSQG